MARIELVIFDLDGTLVEAYTQNLLPRVKEFFHLVTRAGCPQAPRLAVATNQGGVGMRRWMERSGFGRPEKFPTRQEVEARLNAILAALGGDSAVPVYTSYRYRTPQGRWVPAPPEAAGDPRWSKEWRKPEPGMLLQAMQDAGARPEQTLFVGDRPDDQLAAQAAGCRFRWAKDFFNRDWTGCEQLSSLADDE